MGTEGAAGAGRRGGNTSDGESSSFGAHSRNIFIFSLSLGAEYWPRVSMSRVIRLPLGCYFIYGGGSVDGGRAEGRQGCPSQSYEPKGDVDTDWAGIL